MAETEKRSGNQTLACLTIDDPLIRPRYGCLDYKLLLNEMKEHDFFTEIAFIPWNCRRSERETVRLFADNPDRFALCVHGCNHTGNEFGRGTYHELRALARTALDRMDHHGRVTGLPYDPVMVFPQGKFSSAAMQALKDEGYLAAVNSSIRAIDHGEPPALEYRKPATRIYSDFPLFLRRYPGGGSHFIEDIRLGRPVIMVLHHGAFRNGYRELTGVVDQINRSGNIRWTSLQGIAEHYLGTGAPLRGQDGRSFRYSRILNARVALRRLLSEARDNYVETNSFLNKAYKAVRG